MDKIYEILTLLIWGEPLPERCHEHGLSGNYEGLTDCHIEGDWVMIASPYGAGGLASRKPENNKANEKPILKPFIHSFSFLFLLLNIF
jgi:hypothetical protein